MDVNIKGVDSSVLARLAQQAAAEGLSQQEWLRQTLQRTAARLSPAELAARLDDAVPMTDAEFGRIRKTVAARHRANVDRLGASRRRR